MPLSLMTETQKEPYSIETDPSMKEKLKHLKSMQEMMIMMAMMAMLMQLTEPKMVMKL